MNGNLLLLANEIWIKLDRMIVELKSLKRGFHDERNWHEAWDHREYECKGLGVRSTLLTDSSTLGVPTFIEAIWDKESDKG